MEGSQDLHELACQNSPDGGLVGRFRRRTVTRFIIVVALMMAATGAYALEPVTVTIDGVSSTDTVRGVDISSQTTFNIIISTLPLYRQACVQNVDTTSYVACGDNANVSTVTTSNLIGVIIPAAPTVSTPASPLCFSVPAGNPWYCRTSSVTGSTRAIIQRGR